MTKMNVCRSIREMHIHRDSLVPKRILRLKPYFLNILKTFCMLICTRESRKRKIEPSRRVYCICTYQSSIEQTDNLNRIILMDCIIINKETKIK